MILAELDEALQGASSSALGWVDPGLVETALRFAGWTYLCMGRYKPAVGMVVSRWEYPADPNTAYGYTPIRHPRLRPSASAISLADEVSCWVRQGIPDEQRVLRKILTMRSLWDDNRGRYLCVYFTIARRVNCSKTAARQWHLMALRQVSAWLVSNPQRITNFLETFKRACATV